MGRRSWRSAPQGEKGSGGQGVRGAGEVNRRAFQEEDALQLEGQWNRSSESQVAPPQDSPWGTEDEAGGGRGQVKGALLRLWSSTPRSHEALGYRHEVHGHNQGSPPSFTSHWTPLLCYEVLLLMKMDLESHLFGEGFCDLSSWWQTCLSTSGVLCLHAHACLARHLQGPHAAQLSDPGRA